MPKKGRLSNPTQIVALRLTPEERENLQRIADEHGATLSWLIREGAKLYAQELAAWMDERKRREANGGRRLVTD